MTSPLGVVAGKALWAGYFDWGDGGPPGVGVLVGFVTREDSIAKNGRTLFPRPIPNRVTTMMDTLERHGLSLGPGLAELGLGVTHKNIVNFNVNENILRGEEGTFKPKGLLIWLDPDRDIDYLRRDLRLILYTVMHHIGQEWVFNNQRVDQPLGIRKHLERCLNYSSEDTRSDLRYWLAGESIARFGPPVRLSRFKFFSAQYFSQHHPDHMDFIHRCWKEGETNCTWDDFKNYAVPLEYLHPKFSQFVYAVAHLQSWQVHFQVLIRLAVAIVQKMEAGWDNAEAVQCIWKAYVARKGIDTNMNT